MQRAELRYIIVGIESSNEKLLKENSRQPTRKEDILRKIRILERLGVIIQTNYIFGYPGETEESVLNTQKC